MTQEKDVERKLVQLVERHGGLALKWVCPGHAGVPDRLVLFPGGHVAFIELKRPNGGRISPRQRAWERKLKGLGFLHLYVKDDDGLRVLEKFIEEWKAGEFKE